MRPAATLVPPLSAPRRPLPAGGGPDGSGELHSPAAWRCGAAAAGFFSGDFLYNPHIGTALRAAA